MSHPKNIQEFVAYKAIEYAKERDEYIKELLEEIADITEHVSGSRSMKHCCYCNRWIKYFDDCQICQGCESFMCNTCYDDHSDEIGLYGGDFKFWLCKTCIENCIEK